MLGVDMAKGKGGTGGSQASVKQLEVGGRGC